jgi:hypothetical protein
MGGNQRVELNERTVKALPVPEAGNKVHFFAGATLQGVAAPPGFGICVLRRTLGHSFSTIAPANIGSGASR